MRKEREKLEGEEEGKGKLEGDEEGKGEEARRGGGREGGSWGEEEGKGNNEIIPASKSGNLQPSILN